MPYYVLCDSSRLKNQPPLRVLYRLSWAEICERDNQRGMDSEGDRLVMMIYAENRTHAVQRIKQIRRERALNRLVHAFR